MVRQRRRLLDVASSVVVLLFNGCPTAILRRVVPVVVDSVEGVKGSLPVTTGRAWTHVGKKVIERFQPAGTYGDPTTTVVVIILRQWVRAAVLHLRPRLIFGREPSFAVSVTEIDSGTVFTPTLDAVASTRL